MSTQSGYEYNNKKTKWTVLSAGAVLLVIIVLAASCGSSDSEDSASTRTTVGSTEIEPAEEPVANENAAKMKEGEDAEDRGDFATAIAAFTAAGADEDVDRVRKTEASRAAAAVAAVSRARESYRAGQYKTAERRARAALQTYGGQAEGATRIRNQSRARIRAVAARKKRADRAKQVAAAAQRRADREQAAAAAAAEDEAPDTTSAGTPDYSGMTCSEIGHSYNVAPGTDRDHDANGDGVACESE